jgi:hypothetical protein
MAIPSTPATIQYLRESARDLLNEFDAADALASYCALYHDPHRTALFVHRNAEDVVDGFLARCQTGFDLFRPLVTMRVRGNGALSALLESGLTPGRPYLIALPARLAETVATHVSLSEVAHNLILRLAPERFQPIINVLVSRTQDPSGNPRAIIRRDNQVIASAGVNWRSPVFAEIFVHVEAAFWSRGYGRSVLSAVVEDVLKLQVMPIYAVERSNEASRKLAQEMGFVDTGAREMMAQAVRTSETNEVE